MDPFARRILIYPRATSALEAKFSMPWCAALTWLEGPPTIETFRPERVLRDEVEQLAARVAVLDGSPASESVEVAFADGTSDTETITLPLGHPARPLSREQHLGKVHACLSPRLGDERAHRVISHFERLEDAPSIRTVLAELRVGAPG